MGGHHKAKNWGCPDTVDTNGSSPVAVTIADPQSVFSCVRKVPVLVCDLYIVRAFVIHGW